MHVMILGVENTPDPLRRLRCLSDESLLRPPAARKMPTCEKYVAENPVGTPISRNSTTQAAAAFTCVVLGSPSDPNTAQEQLRRARVVFGRARVVLGPNSATSRVRQQRQNVTWPLSLERSARGVAAPSGTLVDQLNDPVVLFSRRPKARSIDQRTQSARTKCRRPCSVDATNPTRQALGCGGRGSLFFPSAGLLKVEDAEEGRRAPHGGCR
jgi:hypothetical protein